jgi:hypothetical protein
MHARAETLDCKQNTTEIMSVGKAQLLILFNESTQLYEPFKLHKYT